MILDRLQELGMTPRDYQKDMIVGLSESKSKRTLMQMETGTGKTVVFGLYAILRAVLDNKRVLIIVGSEELLDQSIKTMKMIKPGMSVGRFIGSSRDYDAQVVVASLQTIKNLPNLIVLDDDFEVIIYDEAHHATSPTSRRVFYRYGLCDLDTAGHENVELVTPHISETRELIGVTATPERTDGTPLGKIFHDRIDGPPIEWFIQQGYLCDLKFLSVETGIDLSDVRSYLGDFSEGDVAKKLIASGYLNEISRVIDEYADDRKSILLYVPNVITAKIAAQAINDAGIKSDYVIGAERKRRSEVISRFKRGGIRVLVNCLVLKEGFDAPNADCIILCRPTKSASLLKQIIGRLTRPHEGKDKGLFIDLGFQRRQDDIITASNIFQQSELQESEQEDLTVRERIELQIQKAWMIHRFRYLIDRHRHELELSGAGEPEPESKAKVEKDDELYYEDVPDTVQLLVDTRFLTKFGLTYSEFKPLFADQIRKLQTVGQQQSLWTYAEADPRQIKKLSDITDIPEEDLSIMSWIEAQALAHLVRDQRAITIPQINYLKSLKFKGEMPKTERLASQLIGKLTGRGRRLNRGRA